MESRGRAPGLRPCVPCPILTLAQRSVSRPSAPHPLAGGLAASLPERGSLGCGAFPSLPGARLPSPPLPCAAPRPRPARASLLPPLPGTGSLSAPAAAAAALPDPTLLVAGAGAAAGGVGREGRKRGQREGPGGVGRSLARQPSFLSVHLAAGRERQPRQQPGGLCTERGRLRDRQTDGRTERTLPELPRHGREEAIREGGRGRRSPCLF